MKIVVYRKDNGVGLTNDGLILQYFLIQNKHQVILSDPDNFVQGDLAFHLEIPCWRSLKTNIPNILIPNQDWWLWDTVGLTRFTEIACKTYGGVKLFKQFNDNTSYLGFTSRNRGVANFTKKHSFLHIAGKSTLKGTKQVIAAWKKEFPKLTIVDAVGRYSINSDNINYIVGYLPENELIRLQQNILYHIQCSEIEGYGHVLGESNSTGNLLITTNAPPMNEFIAACYTSYSNKTIYNMGVRFTPDVKSIQKCVENVLEMKYKDIVEKGKEARLSFLTNRKIFINRLERLVKKYDKQSS